MKRLNRPFPIALVTLAALGGCGGDNTVQPPPVTTTPTTLGPTPTTTSTTTTTTQPVDPAIAKCSSLQPGPVVRYAISPREQREDGVQTDGMRVRARPGFDEVWCIDKDKEHRLDFNSNQRNADGKECCWVNDPEWKWSDPDHVVDQGAPVPNTNNFNYRMRINTHGARATVEVQAVLDGNESFAWQSGSGYQKGPLRVVAMSQNEINRDCKCIFRGNGIYEGDGCTK
jgi:hypothetical protein